VKMCVVAGETLRAGEGEQLTPIWISRSNPRGRIPVQSCDYSCLKRKRLNRTFNSSSTGSEAITAAAEHDQSQEPTGR
jgi:hypothetical protein